MIFSPIFLAACAGLVSQAVADCSRSMLQEATAGYLAAVAAGKQTFAALGTDKVEYVENGSEADITKGILSQAIHIDFNVTLYDTTQCASYTEIVSADAKHPYVIGSRLAFDANNKVNRIDQNVCTSFNGHKDWAFDATGTLRAIKKENWDIIPEAKRDTRDAIQKAADAYIDGLGDSGIKQPVAASCVMLEGGSARTGCALSFGKQTAKITDRRYTIDEEVGGVDVFHPFPYLDKAVGKPTTTNNLIKVQGGSILIVHEDTVILS
ncbi:hypothetical protein SPI_01246 [Niveomyces insectorum RCEF 264]|uniref:DUF8021 domain-containing protein n=1 Tax=Niveomyces insectorum RCEF 264 TaxID=1081102 RepID=A0A162MTF5_9HYPO|nr:hypothetical protein SPI_01246 [Niveomyces insectorum RCEF 264]